MFPNNRGNILDDNDPNSNNNLPNNYNNNNFNNFNNYGSQNPNFQYGYNPNANLSNNNSLQNSFNLNNHLQSGGGGVMSNNFNINNDLNNNIIASNVNPLLNTNNNNFANYNYGTNVNNLNTSQQELNNSMPNAGYNMNQLGFGILNRAMGSNLQNMDLASNFNNNNYNMSIDQYNPRRQTVNLSQMAGNMNYMGDAPMFYNTMRNDPNLINRFIEMQNLQNMQNLNTQNEEEMKLRQEEEIQRMLEDELRMQNIQDDLKNYMKTNKNITYIKQDLFDIRRPEYFNERDRFFFEELIQQPLKTNGFLGMGNVNLDKAALWADNSAGKFIEYGPQQNEYFDKISKDGVFLDYVKKKVYSYNIQKLEQRLLREVLFYIIYL